MGFGKVFSSLMGVASANSGKLYGTWKGMNKGHAAGAAFHLLGTAWGLSNLKNVEPQHRASEAAKILISGHLGLAYPGIAGFAMGIGADLAFAGPTIGRTFVQGVRSGIEARSMLSVPFSYSTSNMEQAGVALQIAQKSMGSAYSSISEASVFAAKYMRR